MKTITLTAEQVWTISLALDLEIKRLIKLYQENGFVTFIKDFAVPANETYKMLNDGKDAPSWIAHKEIIETV